ncbi:MAG: hypothetical protein E6Q59_07790 [Nitrosomonas sp.]|nr:MAG: hypothetical protein E6Q59_07790 [Nitrosomonas sp.]
MSATNRLSLGAAIAWIALSVVVISGSAAACWYYYGYLQKVRSTDSAFNVSILVQTGPEREALKNSYLAEVLDLSIDQPTNIYAFDLDKARDSLLASPVIKEAVVKAFNPGTVYVDYTIRKPVAYIGDYTNTAVDQEGFLFPAEPYYTPKRLPEVYLGLPEEMSAEDLWGQQLHSVEYKKALDVIAATSRIFGAGSSRVIKVDVSKAFADSYGKRQIVLTIEEQITQETASLPVLCCLPRILRLHSVHYEAALREYVVLRDHLRGKLPIPDGSMQLIRHPVAVIDLRLPSLAYVTD